KRTLIYWRPRAVVILDRVVLTDPSAGVAFAFHSTVEPLRAGPRTSIGVGDSRLDLTTVEPSHPQIQVVRQPTSPHAGPHRQDDPWGPSWRMEIAGRGGTKDRKFLHILSRGTRQDAPAPAVAVVGRGLRGVAMRGHGVVFIEGTGSGRAPLPAGTS